MAKLHHHQNQNLSYVLMNLSLLFRLSWLPISFSLNLHNPVTLSSYHYSETSLTHYAWRYITVDLPLGFAIVSINLKTNVDIDARTVSKIHKSKLPIICFRNGSPPLPDVSNTSLTVLSPPTNDSIEDIQARQLVEQCHPLQENIMLALTNDQITSGVWYIGIFNGYGPASTQSKMITRGKDISFSANFSVEGCPTSAMWGQYCNRTVLPLSCAQIAEKPTTCRNSFGASCIASKAPRGYSLDVTGMVEWLKITAVNLSVSERPINNTGSVRGILYARYGAMPSDSVHDYFTDISESSLVIHFPRIGRWYISLLPGKRTEGWVAGNDKDMISDLCYSLDWQIHECPAGKAGLNCTWESYMLQTVFRKSPSGPFESYYWPLDETVTPGLSEFLLEPRLSNSSLGGMTGYAWTYFLLEIPRGAAGGNIHVQLSSDVKVDYEIYSRYGGLPSLTTWDYFYANKTSYSNGSVFFKLYRSSEKVVNFYIFYAKEGTWSFGLRHRVHTGGPYKHLTFMSISSERCPDRCSSHGKCQNVLDASGLTLYSYCSCDRDHGGFDCSTEIVSRKGHILQSIALIASNGAALLPAFVTLRQKALAEWVLFTSSGISSGLYHACDVGTWCALSFQVLQFMDFWLSFMAVVSTFVYLANIDEVSKRAIHTAVSILTALRAVTGATRSSNIILVIAIGASGLVVGWLIESSSTIRSLSFSTMLSLNVRERWQNIKDRLYNLMKTLRSRFRLHFVIIGFIFLSLAGLSWKLESDASYWIWHSIWHVSIYTSSFFFICSKVSAVDRSTPEGHSVTYELTRQDSSSRV